MAVCDLDLIGKRFEEDIRQLEVRESFFKDKELSHEEAVKLMSMYTKEDATFNIVGEKSIKAAIEAGLITEDSIATIQNIPFALVLI